MDSAKNLDVRIAAKIMDKGDQFIRIGLQRGLLPFGLAVKSGSKYSYYINPAQFAEYNRMSLEELEIKTEQ